METQIKLTNPGFPCVCLYQGISRLSRAIRWWSWSMYSHAAWWDPIQGLYEAWYPDGTRRLPSLHEGHTPGTRVDLFAFRDSLEKAERRELARWFEQHRGERYDVPGLLGFVSRRHIESPGRWFCSEYVFSGFLSINRRVIYSVKPYQVMPADFAKTPALKRLGYVIVGDEADSDCSMCKTGRREMTR